MKQNCPRVGVVLSSGGVRGVYAHTGFLLALEQLGIPIAAAAGCSAGAVVGGVAASGTDLRAWLFTLMHNLFLNQIRAHRPPDSALDEALDIPVSGGQMEALGARDIHAALARLPHQQREVMLLVGLEQFAYVEAAQVLGVPVGTVMSRLSRARERMRQMLAGEPVVQLRVVK